MSKKDTGRMDTSRRDNGHEQMVERVREQERKAVEKAMDIAKKVYGPAFEELEKY